MFVVRFETLDGELLWMGGISDETLLTTLDLDVMISKDTKFKECKKETMELCRQCNALRKGRGVIKCAGVPIGYIEVKEVSVI